MNMESVGNESTVLQKNSKLLEVEGPHTADETLEKLGHDFHQEQICTFF